MTFGEILKRLRNEQGLTQAELGKKIGAAKQTISNWENDLRFPPKETIRDFSKIFDVSVDYLMGNTNIRNEKYFVDPILKILRENGYSGNDKREIEEISQILNKTLEIYKMKKG